MTTGLRGNEGEYVFVPPKVGRDMCGVGRVNGSNVVNVTGFVPPAMTAEQAIALGHRLVEAGLGARP